jgi:hypothetical protein
MKKIFTNLKKISFGIFASVLFAGSMQATTYTASQSGNWSSALTWGGSGSPGNSVSGVDNVVIPAGINVTLDMDVTVSSLLSYINVNGSLTATTNSLTISQGSIQGAGTMSMYYVEFSTLGSMTFSGTMTTGRFVNSGATITLGSGIIINDTLILNSGSIAFNAGSTLTMNANSIIKMAAGSITVSTGILTAVNNYDVIYVGSSKTSGIEAGISNGAHNLWVNMSDSSQVVTLGSSLSINGTIHNTMGKLAIGANTLGIMGDYMATSNGEITGIATSRLVLGSATAISSSLAISAGSQFQYIESNMGASVNANVSGHFSVDTMNIKNGSLNLASGSSVTMSNNGVFIWENGTCSIPTAGFIGTNSYSVIYKGGAKNASYEISGSGLHNVTVDMTSNANAVTISNNLTIGGMLSMNNGSLNLNSHSLYLNGTYSSTATGFLQGSAASSVKINNTATAFGDTLSFTAAQAMLDTLTINTMSSGWVLLGSNLTAGNVVMMSGGVMLTTGDLTINSTGSITGYDSTKYIGINGSGSLVMNVNTSSPYVLFPIGTNSSYSPASLQLTSGTSGMFHVNVTNGMWSGGTSGTNMALTQSVVNRTWYIQEPAQTGGALNASLKVEWKASEEMNGFDRTHAFVSHFTSSAWDAASVGAAVPVNGTFYSMIRSNLSSFSPFAVVDQNAVTGIDKVSAANSISLGLYPNPASGVVSIDFKNTDAKSLEVYNEIGNKVYSAEVVNKNSVQKIDISSLPAGVYYVKVSTATEPLFKKLIKS